MLLLRAVVVVLVVRIALFGGGARAAKRAGRFVARGTGQHPVDRLAWAVAVAGAYIPRITCLTQALALQAMLARAGHWCRVEIGIVKDTALQAHAWVVAGDRIVLGGTDVERYCPIGTLE